MDREIGITRAQIAKVWATAHELGLGRERLYTMVPGGSISHLTRVEASSLIDRLEAIRRAGPGEAEAAPGSEPATPKQLHFIYYLFGRLGWLHDPNHIGNFLRKYFRVNRIEDLPNRRRAGAVIEALKAIAVRRRKMGPGERRRKTEDGADDGRPKEDEDGREVGP